MIETKEYKLEIICREFMKEVMHTAIENLKCYGTVEPVLLVATPQGKVFPLTMRFKDYWEKIIVFEAARQTMKKFQPLFAIHVTEIWDKEYNDPNDPEANDHSIPVSEREGRTESVMLFGKGNGFTVVWLKPFTRDENDDPVITDDPPRELSGGNVIHSNLFDGVFAESPASGTC